MPYYPDSRPATRLTTIQRAALLPEEALGIVQVMEEQTVDIRNIVARGTLPARHVIIETRSILGNLNDVTLNRLLLVKERTLVSARDAIAGKDAKRGRRVFAPVDGMVVHAGNNRIIMQEKPTLINVEAGVRGTVTEVIDGRGVHIRAMGVLVQGMWGNGRNVINPLRLEPPSGIESAPVETLDTTFKNEIVVTSRPITSRMLDIAIVRGFAGLIAPSMDASLIKRVSEMAIPVMLTDGFGDSRMNPSIITLLQEFDSQQATLDAYMPRRFEPRRPELVINRRVAADEEIPPSETGLALRRGMRVRVTRAPYAGQQGKVVEIPEHPVQLSSGLRVMCARIDMGDVQPVDIPLVNLEFAGR